MADLRRTPLTDWHSSHGAKMVPFAGFNMPVQYADGIQKEVRTVRHESGLFDLCHMGRLVLRGPDRVKAADHVLSQNVADKIPLNAIRYALICTPEGTVIDDVLTYKAEDAVHVVINAANRATDDAWFREHTSGFDVEIENVSDEQTMIALQGPKSKDILATILDEDLAQLKYYRFMPGTLLGDVPALVSRTGYTGEDGFELFFAVEPALRVWEALHAAGAKPIGLGARDVCRTEAGMPLYGQEMNRETTPLEADLGFGVDLSKDFIGCEPLRAQRDAGVPRGLVGLEVEGRRVPRLGCKVLRGGAEIGTVTSGTFSPTLDRPIAMAVVAREHAREGVDVEIDLRGKPVAAKVEGLPFYSRKRKKKAPGANA
ncbi:MAG: glycine cleavage system aminomethyltransferase GcvT [Planctomycetota bacterium]|jgi:aminomethyltransferase